MRRISLQLPLMASLLAGPGLPVAVATDALVPGTEFHATGSIPCAVAAGQPMMPCQFGVRREGGGTARVTVFLPGGGTRVIRFEQGRVTGVEGAADSQTFSVEREGDLNQVRSGAARFEIPDAVVFGG